MIIITVITWGISIVFIALVGFAGYMYLEKYAIEKQAERDIRFLYEKGVELTDEDCYRILERHIQCSTWWRDRWNF